MPVRILETTVTPAAGGGSYVHLQIGDAALDAENATLRVQIHAKIPAYETPLLLHFQREAMKAVGAALNQLADETARQLNNKPEYPLSPKPLG
jgi:hypothetical protein